MSTDEKQNSAPLPGCVRETRALPELPDPNKLPALSYYERHPEWRPRRQPWRRSIRKRLESA